MRRPKRTRQLKVWVREELAEQYELFRAETSNVISMSAFLAEILEQHAEEREAMRIVKQKLGRRIGNQ